MDIIDIKIIGTQIDNMLHHKLKRVFLFTFFQLQVLSIVFNNNQKTSNEYILYLISNFDIIDEL